MTASNIPLGPGTLTIGEVGTEIDASCLINNAKITWEKSQDDPKTKLCGDVSAGATTYTATLEGNVDQDLADAGGLHHLSTSAKGTEVAFTYTPHTATGASATGTLTIDPLDFGGDEMGKDMTSDFAWVITGDPVFVYGTGGAVALADDEDLVDV